MNLSDREEFIFCSRGQYRSNIRPVQVPTFGNAVFQILRQSNLHKNKKVLSVGFLWLFGLFAIFMCPAPLPTSIENQAKFESYMKDFDRSEPSRRAALMAWSQKEYEVQQAKGWFWRFDSEKRERVHRLQDAANIKKEQFNAVDKEAQRKLAKAKGALGVWSEAGVSEGRHLFWESFEAGKVFGRRQTFWDGVMTILTSREEGVIGMLVQFITQAMINFTTGLMGSLFIFLFKLPSLLWSYRPNIISGILFFCVALVGAISVVSSFLLLMYGAGATAVYTLSKINSNRLGGAQRPQMNYRRSHYD